ncbi:MAG TPA: LemA family protein [Clostridiaceae bacterium]|jgi:LemA protein|nr:LemA family protein [Clostridiaceae bacterium]
MKKGTIALIVIGVIVLIMVLSVIGSYNSLVGKQEIVQNALSEIDNNLQRRNDLIPNLVATVKGYAAHESEILTAIADARSKLIGAGSIGEKAEASSELSNALSRLLVVVENYPQLKADAVFIDLSDNLAGTENRLANARRDYNNVARDYNTSIRRFPTVIFARLMGFEPVEYFEADEGAKEAPKVEF